MAIDLPTILLVAVAMAAMASATLFLLWLQDRRQHALLWMAAAPLLTALGALLRVALPDLAALIISNIVILLAASSFWATCRLLRGMDLAVAPFLAPGAVWIAAFAWPSFAHDINARIAVASALCAIMIGLAFRELWADRRDKSAADRVLLWVVGLYGIIMAVRCVTATAVPHEAVLFMVLVGNLALLTLGTLILVMILSLNVMILVKDRTGRSARREAETDHLTGLPNRRQFERDLAAGFDRAVTFSGSIALAMIDVDDFKAYNDQYGHLAGDVCLQKVAAVLSVHLTALGTSIYRYGGEEFVVVLPGLDGHGAARVAEVLRETVRRLAVPHGRRADGIVTISLGCAGGTPERGDDPIALIEAADRALYRAKAAGRDRTCVAVSTSQDVRPDPAHSAQFRFLA